MLINGKDLAESAYDHHHPHTHMHEHLALDKNHTHYLSTNIDIVENFIIDICLLYQEMKKPVYSSDIISRFLLKLKTDFTHEEIYVILNDLRIRKIQSDLHSIMSAYEFKVEANYTTKMILHPNPNLSDVLNSYYNGVYDNLIKLEIKSLYTCCPDLPSDTTKLHIIFIGSGPFPASALVFYQVLGAKITCIDIDLIAIDLSTKLIQKLNLNDKISIKQSIDDVDLIGNEIIWIANLVFDKQNVLQLLIQKFHHGIFAIRSTEGLKTLRYESINEDILANLQLERIGIKNPNANLSSTLFYKSR